MRTHLVVVGSPGLDERLGVEKAREPVAVQALVAELPVEALDVRVLHRLARSNEVKLDLPLVRPLIERLAGDSGPLSLTTISGSR